MSGLIILYQDLLERKSDWEEADWREIQTVKKSDLLESQTCTMSEWGERLIGESEWYKVRLIGESDWYKVVITVITAIFPLVSQLP